MKRGVFGIGYFSHNKYVLPSPFFSSMFLRRTRNYFRQVDVHHRVGTNLQIFHSCSSTGFVLPRFYYGRKRLFPYTCAFTTAHFPIPVPPPHLLASNYTPSSCFSTPPYSLSPTYLLATAISKKCIFQKTIRLNFS